MTPVLHSFMDMPAADDVVRLTAEIQSGVLDALKAEFIGKDEIIDLLGVCLVAGENLFLLGPPGTAKSALVNGLAAKLNGRSFDYLLTRFTEPGELFGPFDIRRLREGELVTNTEGMLPEADFVFLDELLNANSAILNSLLMALNERVFRRGRETRALSFVMAVGASNRLPEDEALAALFDRFLLRVHCDNVPVDQLESVLTAGWKLQQGLQQTTENRVSAEDVRVVQRAVSQVDVTTVRTQFAQLVQRLRNAGIQVSDRRAVRLQRLIAASALMCGRQQAVTSDLWVSRYTWDTAEQMEVLKKVVSDVIDRRSTDPEEAVHPRARTDSAPDPERLSADLAAIRSELDAPDFNVGDQQMLCDRLSLLAGRLEWITNEESRRHLREQVDQLFARMKNDAT